MEDRSRCPRADQIGNAKHCKRVAVPAKLPIGLTDEFADDPSRQKLWQAVLRKNELTVTPLEDVVRMLRGKLEPALRLAVVTKR
jgi:hypothetical protein